MTDVKELDLEEKYALNKDLIDSLKDFIYSKIKNLPVDDAFNISGSSLCCVMAHFILSAIDKKYPKEHKKLLNNMFNYTNEILDLWLNQDKKNAH